MRVHLVSAGFRTANGQGFLAPLLRLQRRLREIGIEIHIFTAYHEAIADCDVLGIESGALRGLWQDGRAPNLLERMARGNPNLAYFDVQDSTGTVHHGAFDFCALYFKNQLLRDRSLYAQPHYGGRLFTDFYHRTCGVTDAEPLNGEPLDDAQRAKLKLSWNSGFADYSIGGILLREAYARVPLPLLLRRPRGFVDPAARRPVSLGFRMTRRYARATVAHQRIQVAEQLRLGAETRLSRGAFMRELARTKAVLSPFGWGEINLRDYEACIAGAALIKPDMSHLETWPDLFRPDSYIAFQWDFSDLETQVARAGEDDAWRIGVASRAQTIYRRAVASEEGDVAFCARFASLMQEMPKSARAASASTARH